MKTFRYFKVIDIPLPFPSLNSNAKIYNFASSVLQLDDSFLAFKNSQTWNIFMCTKSKLTLNFSENTTHRCIMHVRLKNRTSSLIFFFFLLSAVANPNLRMWLLQMVHKMHRSVQSFSSAFSTDAFLIAYVCVEKDGIIRTVVYTDADSNVP